MILVPGCLYRDEVAFAGLDGFLSVRDDIREITGIVAEVFRPDHRLDGDYQRFGDRKKAIGVEERVIREDGERVREEHRAAGIDVVSGGTGHGGDDEAVARYPSFDIFFRSTDIRFEAYGAVDAADRDLVEGFEDEYPSVRLPDACLYAGLWGDLEFIFPKERKISGEIVLIQPAKEAAMAEIDAEDGELGAREEVGGIKHRAVAADCQGDIGFVPLCPGGIDEIWNAGLVQYGGDLLYISDIAGVGLGIIEDGYAHMGWLFFSIITAFRPPGKYLTKI